MVKQTVILAIASLLPAWTVAQQIGHAIPEKHPKLITYRCTERGGCVQRDTAVVLDEFYRKIHEVNDTTVSCGTWAGLNTSLCPDAGACAKNCAVEGVDYAANGVQTDGDALVMNQFVKAPNGTYLSAGPRAYLLDVGGKDYELFQLLNMEITFDVDVSKLVCGMNGALYLTEMEANGGRSRTLNPAGAAYGTGYCDAQCPKLAWINGVANPNLTHGACCNEMDLLESNALVEDMTPHACNISGVYLCTGDDECDQATGVCDEYGCGWNPYVYNVTEFYGPGRNYTINTQRNFTVVTQFITDDGTSSGSLIEIRRLYVQGGRVIRNAAITVEGITTSVMDDAYCNATASWFQQRGGLADMGEALGRGMVLVFSIWDDTGGYMNWLDSGDAGPCSATEGDPALIVEEHPDTKVIYSKIRYGEIGSTF
ncbi:putative endo-beta-1,4-glucanase celB [Cytospora mali]|uniref:Glucanase n=1 Tax=Cytospora mali TaxID=578113 RepID=A0A194VM68_CYTMA|nr:putative endo-beta-1,4-glucanase celB [Valsa mali]